MVTAEQIHDPQIIRHVFERLLILAGDQRENARAVIEGHAALFMVHGRGFAQVSIVETSPRRVLWINAAAGRGMYCPSVMRLMRELATRERCHEIRLASPDARKRRVLIRLGLLPANEKDELVWVLQRSTRKTR